jgi:acyl-homoserine lactone acylase PvdQ
LSGRARWLTGAAIVLAALAALPAAVLYLALRGSLPRLDGRIAVRGLRAPVTVERDALGVVTIEAANRDDLAFGTGFAHGEDRFFQMDLARRLAAGELSALVGPAALSQDRQRRLFRFREVARLALAEASPRQRELLAAYARGVNAGLASLPSRPWEYWMLRTSPEPWGSPRTRSSWSTRCGGSCSTGISIGIGCGARSMRGSAGRSAGDGHARCGAAQDSRARRDGRSRGDRSLACRSG